ncbi:geranylgeranylglycerol-phosphate geranylgeranyltransferase [Fulvivirgaceae bacterium BMA10]|uniref:Geranylgeranylglycerol-phosphate geranylgeranyltransferase n=1 Tax=Splendidivirga corallicola TaxID=3051826 RepID=A0ABT8KRY7_9BACT|nr:geranylgeranylglycerol-phosphate geranylgeranyltransferase [Fulvivirgaceae bacterium BMA10]
MGSNQSKKAHNFSFSGFVKLVRWPNLLIISITQYITAIFLVGDIFDWRFYITDIRLFILSLSTILIAAAGYIINDYYDVKIDLVNKPNRVVVGNLLKRRPVMAAHTALNFLGIILGAFVSYKIMLINFLAALLLWLYSNQLKRWPFIGNLTISILTGLSLIVVGVYYQQNEHLIYVYALFAFSISLIREIIKDMEDVKGDEVFGCKTLPIIWGIRRTKFFIYILSVLFALSLFYLTGRLDNPILTKYFILLIIPILYFIYALIRADTKKQYTFLSAYCKFIMLSGILSMTFF